MAWPIPPLRREYTLLDEPLSKSDSLREVDFEHHYRCTANRRLADEDRSIPPKVAKPAMSTRIEQGYELSGFRIDSPDVRPFVVIARKTCQTQVTGLARPAMLFGYDMVDVKRKSIKLLRNLAVLAGVPRSLPYEFVNAASHGWLACPGTSVRPFSTLE